MHGHLQPVALGQPVRDGDRPRHGLPRLEPGRARLRPPDPRPRAAADPRPRGDAALGRHLLPPVPAADAGGERRDRRRLLRRPPLARALDVRLRQGDRRHVDPLGAGRLRGHSGQRRGPAAPPGDEHRVHAVAPRPARAAADRPRRLERLPQPELLLDRAERVVPDGGRRGGLRRGVGDDRGPLPLRDARARGPLPAPRPARGRAADRARARRDMLATVEAEAWDGDWYVRAFDAESRPVGSHVCDEGQIFVESQAWCVLGGAGDDGRARRALESVRERLATPDGIVLHQPAYTPLPRRARRDLELPARLQGERRHLLPHEPVDHARLVPARRRRPRTRDVPRDLPVDARGPDRHLPQRAVRLRADDRRPRRGHCRARRRTRG